MKIGKNFLFKLFLVTLFFAMILSIVFSTLTQYNQKSQINNNDNGIFSASKSERGVVKKKENENPLPVLSLKKRLQKKEISSTVEEFWLNLFDQKKFSASPSLKEIHFQLGQARETLLKLISNKNNTKNERKISFKDFLKIILPAKKHQESIRSPIESVDESLLEIFFDNAKNSSDNNFKLYSTLFSEFLNNLLDGNLSDQEKEWSKINDKNQYKLASIFNILFNGDNPFVFRLKKDVKNCKKIVLNPTDLLSLPAPEILELHLKTNCLKLSLGIKENSTFTYRRLVFFFYQFLKFLYFELKDTDDKNEKMDAALVLKIINDFQEKEEKRKVILDKLSDFLFDDMEFPFYFQDQEKSSKTLNKILLFIIKKSELKLKFSSALKAENNFSEGMIGFFTGKGVKSIQKYFLSKLNELLEKKIPLIPRFFNLYLELSKDFSSLIDQLEKNTLELSQVKLFFQNFVNKTKAKNQKSFFLDEEILTQITNNSIFIDFLSRILHLLQKKEQVQGKLINRFLNFWHDNKSKIINLWNEKENNKIQKKQLFWLWNGFQKGSSVEIYFSKVQKDEKLLVFKLKDSNDKKHIFVLNQKKDNFQVIYYQSSWDEIEFDFFLRYYSHFEIKQKLKTNYFKKFLVNEKPFQKKKKELDSEAFSFFDPNFFQFIKEKNQDKIISQEKTLFNQIIDFIFNFSGKHRLIKDKKLFDLLFPSDLLFSKKIRKKNNKSNESFSFNAKKPVFSTNDSEEKRPPFLKRFLHKLTDGRFFQKILDWFKLSNASFDLIPEVTSEKLKTITKSPSDESIEGIFDIIFGSGQNKNFYFQIKDVEGCVDGFQIIRNSGKTKYKINIDCLEFNLIPVPGYKINYEILLEFGYRLFWFLYRFAFTSDNSFKITSGKIKPETIDKILKFYQNVKNQKFKKQINSKIINYFFNQKRFDFVIFPKNIHKDPSSKDSQASINRDSQTLHDKTLFDVFSKELIKSERIRVYFWLCSKKKDEKYALQDFFFNNCKKTKKNWVSHKSYKFFPVVQDFINVFLKDQINVQIKKSFQEILLSQDYSFFDIMPSLHKIIKTDLKARILLLEFVKTLDDPNLSKQKLKEQIEKITNFYQKTKEKFGLSLPSIDILKTLNKEDNYSQILNFFKFLRTEKELPTVLANNVAKFLKKKQSILKFLFLTKSSENEEKMKTWKELLALENLTSLTMPIKDQKIWKILDDFFYKVSIYENETNKFLILNLLDSKQKEHLFVLSFDKASFNPFKVVFYIPDWNNDLEWRDLLEKRLKGDDSEWNTSQLADDKKKQSNTKKKDAEKKEIIHDLNWKSYFDDSFFETSSDKKKLISSSKQETLHTKNKILSLFGINTFHDDDADYGIRVNSLIASLLSKKWKWSKKINLSFKGAAKFTSELSLSGSENAKRIRKKKIFFRLFSEFLKNYISSSRIEIKPNKKDTLPKIFYDLFGDEHTPRFKIGISVLKNCRTTLTTKEISGFWENIVTSEGRVRMDCLKFTFKVDDFFKIGYKKILIFAKRLFFYTFFKFFPKVKINELKFNRENIEKLMKEMSKKGHPGSAPFYEKIRNFLINKLSFRWFYSQNEKDIDWSDVGSKSEVRHKNKKNLRTIKEIFDVLVDKKHFQVEYKEDILACSKWLEWTGLCDNEWKNAHNLEDLMSFLSFFDDSFSDFFDDIYNEIKAALNDKTENNGSLEEGLVSQKRGLSSSLLIHLANLDEKTKTFFQNLFQFHKEPIKIERFLEFFKSFYSVFYETLKRFFPNITLPSWNKLEKEILIKNKDIILLILRYLFQRRKLSSSLVNHFINFWTKLNQNNKDILDAFDPFGSFGKGDYFYWADFDYLNNDKILVLKLLDRKNQKHTFALRLVKKRWKVFSYAPSWDLDLTGFF